MVKCGHCGFLFFQLDLGGRWSLLTGGRCSEVDLALKFFGPDLEWSLLTGGRCSEVVVSTGLTVLVYTYLAETRFQLQEHFTSNLMCKSYTGNLCVLLVYVCIFWPKEIGEQAAHKMLVKLTTEQLAELTRLSQTLMVSYTFSNPEKGGK